MCCPECHGLPFARGIILHSLHKRETTWPESRQWMRLINASDSVRIGLRNEIGCTANDRSLESISLADFGRYLEERGLLDASQFTRSGSIFSRAHHDRPTTGRPARTSTVIDLAGEEFPNDFVRHAAPDGQNDRTPSTHDRQPPADHATTIPSHAEFCRNGWIGHQDYFNARWPNFCSDLPDLACDLVAIMLSKGLMCCPDLHGLPFARDMIRQSLRRRGIVPRGLWQSARLIGEGDIALIRSRNELSYTVSRDRLRILTFAGFDRYLHERSVLDGTGFRRPGPTISHPLDDQAAVTGRAPRDVPTDLAREDFLGHVARVPERHISLEEILSWPSDELIEQALRNTFIAQARAIPQAERDADRLIPGIHVLPTTTTRPAVTQTRASPQHRPAPEQPDSVQERSFAWHVQAKRSIFEDDCVICLEAFGAEQKIVSLPCVHFFHKACLVQSIAAQNRSCPRCRTGIHQDIIDQAMRESA